jgi:hypothetical protein
MAAFRGERRIENDCDCLRFGLHFIENMTRVRTRWPSMCVPGRKHLLQVDVVFTSALTDHGSDVKRRVLKE